MVGQTFAFPEEISYVTGGSPPPSQQNPGTEMRRYRKIWEQLLSDDMNPCDRHRNRQGLRKCYPRRNAGLKGTEKKEKVADFQTFIRRKCTKLATLPQTCAVLQKKRKNNLKGRAAGPVVGASHHRSSRPRLKNRLNLACGVFILETSDPLLP